MSIHRPENHQSEAFEALLSSSMRERAMDAVREVAERLRPPARVKEVATAPGNVNPVFGAHPWEDVSLSHGYPGIALLFAELDRVEPEAGWDLAAHEHLSACGSALKTGDAGLASLFNGVCAVAFSALAASRGRSRYGGLLDRLDAAITERVREVIVKERARRGEQTGALATAYDVVSGLSGTGCYLLLASDRRNNRDALCEILRYMIDLAEPIEVGGSEVPGWVVSINFCNLAAR